MDHVISLLMHSFFFISWHQYSLFFDGCQDDSLREDLVPFEDASLWKLWLPGWLFVYYFKRQELDIASSYWTWIWNMNHHLWIIFHGKTRVFQGFPGGSPAKIIGAVALIRDGINLWWVKISLGITDEQRSICWSKPYLVVNHLITGVIAGVN